jgi:hypothetical protein
VEDGFGKIGVCVLKYDSIHEVLRNEAVATAVLLTVRAWDME